MYFIPKRRCAIACLEESAQVLAETFTEKFIVAKPLHGLTPVPWVRIPLPPPLPL
jgi:hypothetical protein